MPPLPVSYTPLAGGNVTISAPEGTVTTDARSLVDVSGSSQITTYLLNADEAPVAQTVASNPGSIKISGKTLSLNGTLQGQAQLAGLQGGTLSIKQLSGSYTLSSSSFANWIGFDAYTFSAYAGLNFSGGLNVAAGRSLTFDAPSFNFTGSGNVNFQAPWIQLWNDVGAPGPTTPAGGSAQLTMASQWIDVEGALSFGGFKSVTLSAAAALIIPFGFAPPRSNSFPKSHFRRIRR